MQSPSTASIDDGLVGEDSVLVDEIDAYCTRIDCLNRAMSVPFQIGVVSMFHMFLCMGVISLSLFACTYVLYFLLVFRTPNKREYLRSIERALKEDVSPEQLPSVSIVVPAYNEEQTISRKLENIAAFEYPREKTEVILIDDCSVDRTSEIAQRMFSKLGMEGKILRNSRRMGANASYNRGVQESRRDLILATDADVMTNNEALISAVKVFNHLENTGGITGRIIPFSDSSTSPVLIERSYRSFFDGMSIAESAIHSTFPGTGGFTLLRKSAFSPIPEQHGSTDGNRSLALIRKGLRFLYVPNVFLYEQIPSKVGEQSRQKIRRAARLIQSTLANKDMLFKRNYGSFGTVIFPLRFAMIVVCPISFFIGAPATLLVMMLASALFSLLLVFIVTSLAYIGTKADLRKLNILSTFAMHQVYLLMGLFLSQSNMAVWKRPETNHSAKDDPLSAANR